MKPVIIIAIAFVLLIPTSVFSEEPSYTVIKYVEKQELQNSDLAIVEFFVLNNSDKSIDITNKVYLSDSQNRQYRYFNQNSEITESNGCLTSIPKISSNISTSVRLCFEIPQNSEDYRLNLTHSELNESIPLYLNSHQLNDNFAIQDLRKIFVTIHDAEIIKTDIGDVVVLNLSVYNGYYSQGTHDKTNVIISLTAKNFFIQDSDNSMGEVVWDQHLTGIAKEKCAKPTPVNSEEIKTLQVCFERPTQGNGVSDSEIFLTMNESTYIYGCADCQEKSWDITPYFSEKITPVENFVSEEDIQKIPNWVKSIFLWYGQDQVSEDELLNAIKYLINEKILVVN